MKKSNSSRATKSFENFQKLALKANQKKKIKGGIVVEELADI